MLVPLRLKKECFIPPVSIMPYVIYHSVGRGLVRFLTWTKSGIPRPLFSTLFDLDEGYLKTLSPGEEEDQNLIFSLNRDFYLELDLNFETMRIELDRRIGELQKPGKVSR